jgi:type III secretory pathway component EscV
MNKVSSNSNSSKIKKKVQTDEGVKKKAVKLVISHLKKKASKDFVGSNHVHEWIEEMEKLLGKTDFDIIEYIQMRKRLNEVIERILDEEMRFKIRDSWYSFGRALDKKAKK